jgi:plasmid stability protein
MAAITVRNLDERLKERLRVRAALHGRSMESEVREILADAVGEAEDRSDLFQTLIERFAELGGVELELPPRTTMRPPPDFSQW